MRRSKSTKPPVDSDLEKCIAECILQARAAGQSIRSHLPELSGRQVVILQGAFKDGLSPPTPVKRGRRPDPELTRAFSDWKAGCRGQRLYRRYIKNHAKLRPSKRRYEEGRLMSAIYMRSRREKEAFQAHEADSQPEAPNPN